jgi:hypothetical protein
LNKRRRAPRRFWIRPTLLDKRTELILQLANEDDFGLSAAEKIRRGYFKSMLWVPSELFELILENITPLIKKQVTKFRKPISPLER